MTERYHLLCILTGIVNISFLISFTRLQLLRAPAGLLQGSYHPLSVVLPAPVYDNTTLSFVYSTTLALKIKSIIILTKGITFAKFSPWSQWLNSIPFWWHRTHHLSSCWKTVKHPRPTRGWIRSSTVLCRLIKKILHPLLACMVICLTSMKQALFVITGW